MLIILALGIAAFGAVFYKLVTTNHWTIGKKLLVCLVASLLVELVGKLIILAFAFPVVMVSLLQIPVIFIGTLMAYFFYRKEDVLG
ncbi:MAG: hypothetical protein PHY47_00935 [Lachnospiraceae bacterium]|nr:hypothetical protein [Lachnospiraceae bacterium]